MVAQLTETHRPTRAHSNLSVLRGDIEIARVVEAVNSLDADAKCAMIAVLKLCAPHVRWVTTRDGKLSVA